VPDLTRRSARYVHDDDRRPGANRAVAGAERVIGNGGDNHAAICAGASATSAERRDVQIIGDRQIAQMCAI
jgi:hypothetical protein